MPPFSSSGVDPYKSFRFKVRFEQGGEYVAGVSKASPLERTTEVVRFGDGGDESTSRKSPGRTEFEAITLERGITHDADFEQWSNKVWDYDNEQAKDAAKEVSVADFRRNMVIDLFDEAGQRVVSYRVFRCWVSEYQALPDLDGNTNAVAIQHIKLENEGWIRDQAVTEPVEPSSNDPSTI